MPGIENFAPERTETSSGFDTSPSVLSVASYYTIILVEMFENGVSGDMVIDYGDYALNAKLAELRLKPYGACK